MEWSQWRRNKIDEMVKKGKMSDPKIGSKDKDGKYYYPTSDQYRGGKEIIETDYQTPIYGMHEVNGNFIPLEINVRGIELLDQFKSRHEVIVRAKKNENKSKPDYFLYSLYGDNVKIGQEADINKFGELNEITFKGLLNVDFNVEEDFAKIINLEKTDRPKVVLKNFTVQNIKKYEGKSSSTQISLDTPDFDKYTQIRVFFADIPNLSAIEGHPINICCELNSFNQENNTITGNGVSYWLDEKTAKMLKDVDPPEEIENKDKNKKW